MFNGIRREMDLANEREKVARRQWMAAGAGVHCAPLGDGVRPVASAW
jgi:hypothetical protein